MIEIWKDVVGFEGRYKVSNIGNIKSLDRYEHNDYHGSRHLKETILKTYYHKKGYKMVILHKEGTINRLYIHRIVATSFIENINNYPTINHIDGIKDNNIVDNLEWCTQKQNVNHAYDNYFNKMSNKTKLIKIIDNSEYYFRSSTKACEFIGRKHGYIYSCNKFGRNIIGIDKNIYIVKMTQGD